MRIQEQAGASMRIIHTSFIIVAVLTAATGGNAAAQKGRAVRLADATGAAPPVAAIAPPSVPEWSGQSGSSGDPSMTAAAIRAAAADFHRCLDRLWPLAARRGISRKVYAAYTAQLTPDLRIMDLLDGQPEFTKSLWDYLDLLVNDERIANGRALLEKYRATFDAVERAFASIATSWLRSGAWRPITARSAATGRCCARPRRSPASAAARATSARSFLQRWKFSSTATCGRTGW